MSTQCPPAPTAADQATPHRTALLMVPDVRDAQGRDALLHPLRAETDALLGQLEGTVERLALAHRSITPDAETQRTDDEAFAWVQQSIEDIAATLRGLAPQRSREHATGGRLHAVADHP
ncbi:hypothetical protein [Arthrobacter sp. TMS1-12-1]